MKMEPEKSGNSFISAFFDDGDDDDDVAMNAGMFEDDG